jgi:DNA-binding LytR/AlgR family response regulator
MQGTTYEFSTRLGLRVSNFNRDDIVAFHASDKYVEVVLRNSNDRPIWTESLRQLIADERFKEDFIPVHRGTLVRFSSIVEVGRAPASTDYFVELKGGIRFPVSRRYYSPVKRMWLDGLALTPAL